MGHVWWGHAWGDCVAGTCMVGEHEWRGRGVTGGHAWQGGMHATHAPPQPLRDMVGQYAGGTHPTAMHSC